MEDPTFYNLVLSSPGNQGRRNHPSREGSREDLAEWGRGWERWGLGEGCWEGGKHPCLLNDKSV